jgi:hypothetical protein
MREVHQIIRDRAALEAFIAWLPVLEPHERFFLCLQARKKYMPSLKAADKTQLKRFTAIKETLIDKIKQLECPLGCYQTKEGDVIPDDGMALYITINPRDMRRATFASIRALVDMIQKQDAGQSHDFNPHSEVLSCIHKSKGRHAYIHFDVDRPTGFDSDENAPKSGLTTRGVLKKASEIVGEDAVTVIETRGGCHLLIDPAKVVCEHKNWHPIIVREIDCDQTGDLMVPVVGCCQGGFVPKFFQEEPDDISRSV